ncbi:MAG TPA: succinyl-diaminopimelate desuccinylase [Hyphomicrobiaceae bacterium]|nr:succinyl-diaminopimelate desuccinylase [Hyphomicrobiaceae bacterium]
MAQSSHDPVALLQALIRCRSVTPAEGGALTLLQSLLEPAGFTCHRLTMTEPGTADVENLYARLGSGPPHLCFAGHTDVVPPGDEAAWTKPPFGGEIANGSLYGRGAVDMKGGVACFLAAALDYVKAGGPKRGSLSFLITGDEESVAINGTPKLLAWLKARGETLDACLVGEPASGETVGDQIKIGRRGYVNARLLVQGKQGHSAYGERAENPIPKLARIIDRLSTTPLDAGSEHFQPSSLQATIISVPNTATNVIPGSAQANFNIRYNDLHTRAGIEAWVRGHCEAAAAEVGARFSLSFEGTGDVFLTKPGPLVDTMRAAILGVTGREPALTTNGGTSDARFIKDFCPVVEVGLRNATAHQVDEHVAVADLTRLTAIYRSFIEGYFRG